MADAVIVERVLKLRRLAESTTYPNEAETATRLASTLVAKHGLTDADLAPRHALQMAAIFDVWMRFWDFTDSWAYQRPRPRRPAEYPSGDRENRDFSAYIGRRCAGDTEFKTFWNEMSKEERRLWRQTYYEPKRRTSA